jgi:predicted phosphodiesterase
MLTQKHQQEESIAVIADIHGNRWALEATLQDIEHRGIKQIVNLGDNLYGPLDPSGTADLLTRLNIPTISGNEDRILIMPPEHRSASLHFTLEQLQPAHFGWLATLPATLIIGDLFLCHGTPADDNTYLLETITPDGVRIRNIFAIQADVATVEQSLILCGHSHTPHTLFLSPDKLIVNPGSVGLPAYTDDLPFSHAMEAGSPHARYVILTNTEYGWQIENILVPYDWKKAASMALSHQRPDWASWLTTGQASVS